MLVCAGASFAQRPRTRNAQNSPGPQTAPLPPAIVAPVDTPYPGTISLTVDLSNVNQRIFNVHEMIPVKPGKVTLLYPQWLPGGHSPAIQVEELAGLMIAAK